jgi:hypothetical protein
MEGPLSSARRRYRLAANGASVDSALALAALTNLDALSLDVGLPSVTAKTGAPLSSVARNTWGACGGFRLAYSATIFLALAKWCGGCGSFQRTLLVISQTLGSCIRFLPVLLCLGLIAECRELKKITSCVLDCK